uniref:Serine hydroxymethyltransferase n=1 Tax=Rhizophora mucronata TaxID=61149 RepID=A0A2P2KFJ8_RHIMU
MRGSWHLIYLMVDISHMVIRLTQRRYLLFLYFLRPCHTD